MVVLSAFKLLGRLNKLVGLVVRALIKFRVGIIDLVTTMAGKLKRVLHLINCLILVHGKVLGVVMMVSRYALHHALKIAT